MENYPTFRLAMLHFGVRTRVLLTRSPLANASHWHADLRRFKLIDADVFISAFISGSNDSWNISINPRVSAKH
jgi:hypothetical protein